MRCSRPLWDKSLIGAPQPPDIPWDASTIGAPRPPGIPLESEWVSRTHGGDGRSKPPIERKYRLHTNVQWRARLNAQWSDSESNMDLSKWTSSSDVLMSGKVEDHDCGSPGQAVDYDKPSSVHVVRLANACETHNEKHYEVVIICNEDNVNDYRGDVAHLARKYGVATFNAVKDDNHKKKKNFKRGGNRPLRVCRRCRSKLFVKMKVGPSSTVQDVQAESAGVENTESAGRSSSVQDVRAELAVSLSESDVEC